MNLEKAIKIAIKALKEEAKKVEFDANMHDKFKADYPLAIKCSRIRIEYREAISIFESLLQDKNLKAPRE